MRVWIDLANSPHPLLFAPVARDLEARGNRVQVTVRDHAQTLELARRHWPDAELIGGGSPGSRPAKAATLAERVLALRRWARANRPDVALSHNSYAQITAARLAGVPVVTAMDYEHQPANNLAFRLATVVLLPEAFPETIARRQGASSRRIMRYPGLKETLYLGDFEPDSSILDRIGIQGCEPDVLAVARTPPSRAVYHHVGNPLFEACLERLDSAGVTTVVLPRYPEQVREISQTTKLERIVVPTAAVDSRSLMIRAGLFLGAGGTMTREAALLGVPAATVFAGEVPAVDRWLEKRGLITRVTAPDELQMPKRAAVRSPADLRQDAEPILRRFGDALDAAMASRG